MFRGSTIMDHVTLMVSLGLLMCVNYKEVTKIYCTHTYFLQRNLKN